MQQQLVIPVKRIINMLIYNQNSEIIWKMIQRRY